MKPHILALLLAAAALTLLVPAPAHAGSATWSGQLNSNWNVFENWSPQTVPNGPSDVATLGSSFNRTVYLSANTEVYGITFPRPRFPIAVNYGITVGSGFTLTISGVGITNSSGQAQNFVTNDGSRAGLIIFANSATAGSATFTTNGGTASFPGPGYVEFDGTSSAASGVFTNNGSTVTEAFGGITAFGGSATAGNGTFTNNGSTVDFVSSGNVGGGGETLFLNTSSAGFGTFTNNAGVNGGTAFFDDNSTAANATFTNNGGMSGQGEGGNVRFISSSTASNSTVTSNGATVSGGSVGYALLGDSATASTATFINNGATATNGEGGGLSFFLTSSADSATLIANGGSSGGGGGSIQFADDSSGGFARAKLFGNGSLDISQHNAPGIGIGSIQGAGKVFLGANDLTVGLNNLSTVFSGVIQDGGAFNGTGGSLTKLGGGKLTLSHANTYTGGTTLNGGTLLIQNKAGSGTGSGAVQVNNGTLGGTGVISNAVTIGNGTLFGAILLAGNAAKNPGVLTINSALTFHSLSGYTCGLKRNISSTGQVTGVAGKVTASGVTINSNVPFTFVDSGTGTLPVGTIFTVINNTSASLIAGRFSNLAGGLTFSSNGNTFKVSYTGGTGNDLTLKVVQ